MVKVTKEESLSYHRGGKIGVRLTKPCSSQRDLSTAYTPGVGFPCKEIERDRELAYEYTNKANNVAVISNGTAVLGFGDIGALASKPVMEGKAVLFKKFAKIDSFDIEINEKDKDKLIEHIVAIADTFGGINLEDIKAPECFEIEREVQKRVNIPVMHDDQHGTAMITAAGLLNSLRITGKKIDEIKIMILGAGASAIASGKIYKRLGVKHIVMVDSRGVIGTHRDDLNKYKMEFAIETDARTKEDAIKDADMLLGLSTAGTVSKEMIASMAKEPVIFTLANPTPEIMPEEIKEVRDDAIIATGRSDYPNQINNVLGFPFIFRGALDVRATKITENMKMAAVRALAELAQEPVPYHVKAKYKQIDKGFGKEHIIPTPFSKELYIRIPTAVAKAAIEDGVARIKDFDLLWYKEKLYTEIYDSEKCS